MGVKSVLLFSFLVAAVAVPVPVARAQLLGGLGGLLGGSGGGGSGGLLGGLLDPIFGLIKIWGIVYCTPNGNMGVNGTATPVFANAGVQLQCGGNVVSTTTTNGSGLFTFLLNPLQLALSTLLSGCNVAVTTPLSTCNATLPSVGGLLSNLQLLAQNLLSVVLGATNFQFNANVRN